MIFVVIRLLRRLFREPTKRRLALTLIAFTISTLVSGTLFYLAEGVYGPQKNLSWPRSLYWAVVTMATVGYGDIVPKTFWGHVITCITIVVGIAMFSLFVSTLADIFMQGSLKRVLGLGRVRNVDVVVVGANEVCREAINELKRNMPRLKISWVMERRPKSPPEDVDFVVGDPTDDDTLRRAGVESAKDMIVCVLDDSAAIHIVLTAKKLNKNIRIAALARSSRTAELLKEAGASIVVPFKRLGRELASAVFEPSVVHFLEEVTTAKGRADLVEIVIDSAHAGKEVNEIAKELQVSDRGSRYLAVMIARKDGERVFAPDRGARVELGDKVVFVKVKEGEQKPQSTEEQE